MSGSDGTQGKQIGDGLGPIGSQALKATARNLGMVDPAQPDTAFEAEWAKFEEFARSQLEDDLIRAKAKAIEYGSHDLEIMATTMEALLPESGQLLDRQSRHAAGLEMGIAFYLMGKASRMFGAFKRGQVPGDDSWRDARIYAMMAAWIRKTGRWVG